jgi:glutamate-ammonia-ligase adenylyltransferase
MSRDPIGEGGNAVSWPDGQVDAAVARAAQLSHWAARTLARRDDWLPRSAYRAPFGPDAMHAALAAVTPDDVAGLDVALRQLRTQVLLHTIVRDLADIAPLREVTEAMTTLAEVAVGTARDVHAHALGERFGTPRDAAGAPQRLAVIGMGKVGGHELNVSSDIDLVFTYPEAGQTDGTKSIDAHEFFTRLVQRVAHTLADVTADGFVFRTDLRLRPWGDSGPLAVSLETLEHYFSAHGRPWERYAWVKARVLGEPPSAPLREVVTPFVYRRHLDFSAIDALRELHAQIRAEVARRDRADDIKVGPGGIREIEFVAQVFQLIRGGREPRLRVRSTQAAFGVIADLGLLPRGSVDELLAAYRFLRALEHRLQYLDDQQTQQLPTDDDARARIADATGHADWPALRATLDAHRQRVTAHFEAVFSTTPGPAVAVPVLLPTADDPATVERLAALGYDAPEAVRDQLVQLRTGARYRRMSASGQSRVDGLLPRLVETAARFAPPQSTLERLLRLVDQIGRRESYLALLTEYPAVLDAVARLVSRSAWACETLCRHPVLMDELLDPRSIVAPTRGALRDGLARELDATDGSTEQQMDALRRFRHVQTFRLLALDLAGALPIEAVSDHLSDLAETILEAVLPLAWLRLATRHRDVPRFAIVGYGKLGGRELGYGSDLDLIFLHDDDHSDAAAQYARLAQRINTWLGSHTGAGVLYETDLRLRPDGAAGLLVSRFEAFETYERNQAWTWEHQALTRARFVAGDVEIGVQFEALRRAVLALPRDRATLRDEVRAMRQKMRDGHRNTTDLFDLKHDPGGIVDVEFAVQMLVLAHAATHPELLDNAGNIALLARAEAAGLLPAGVGAAAGDAYRRWRALQHARRLQGEGEARVPADSVVAERAAVAALTRAVFGLEADGPAPIADAWRR